MKKMTIFLIIGILFIVAGFFVLYLFFFKTNEILLKKSIKINNSVFSVEIASTTVEQSRGLSGRVNLEKNDGMLFLFGISGVKSFWMKDMNFPIDIIWIGNNSSSSEDNDWSGTVLGFVENVPNQPNDPIWKLKIYNSPDGVSSVLEVPAGTVKNDGIKVGDKVNYFK